MITKDESAIPWNAKADDNNNNSEKKLVICQ